FSTLLKHNSPALEVYVSTHLFTVLQKLDGMLELKLKIMLIGIRTKTDFLNYSLFSVGFDFLKLLFLLVDKLAVINDFTNRRPGIRRNLHQIKIHTIGNSYGLF